MFSNSHINEAFSIIEKLLDYDPDIYSDLILSYGGGAWQWSEKNVSTFFYLCDWFSSPSVFTEQPNIKLYFRVNNNEIILKTTRRRGYRSFLNVVNAIKNKVYDNLNALRVATTYHDTMIKFICAELSFKEILNIRIEKVSANTSNPYESIFFKTVKDRWKGNDLKPFLLYCHKKALAHSYLANINAKLFYHLIKSFLNGEYLIFNEYSRRIKGFNIKGDETFDEFTVYSIKSFIKLMWHAEEICSIIRTTIDDPKSDKIIVRVNTDKESRLKSQLSLKQRTLFGKSDTIEFETLMELVIDMTLIDHVYITNIDNIQKLKRLEQQVAIVQDLKGITPEERELLRQPLLMLKEKAKYLYAGMIDSEYDNLNEYTFIIDGKIHHLQSAENYHSKLRDIRKDNPILKLKEEKKNKVINKGLIYPCDTYNGSRSDIRDYNSSVSKAISAHVELSHFYNEVVNNSQISYPNFIKAMSVGKEYRRPSFYIHSIQRLVEIIEKLIGEENASEEEMIKRIGNKIELLRELLGDLYIYIKKCNSQNVSAQFRPYFANSFYSISNGDISYGGVLSIESIDNYDYKHFNDKFFFASVACNPISPTYLEYFRSRYDNIRRELSAKHSALSIKHNTEYSNHIVNEQIATWNTNVETKISESDRKLNDTQRHIVTVLGIFASLIAFAAISIGVIKVATNIQEYFLFVLSFTVGVSVFASLVLPNELEKKWHQKHYNIICALLVLLSLIFGVLHFTKKSNNIENTRGQLYIEGKEERDDVNNDIKNNPVEENLPNDSPKGKESVKTDIQAIRKEKRISTSDQLTNDSTIVKKKEL